MSWQQIRGHEALVQAFQRSYRRGRLGHAYLFCGPAGVGKSLFARELARALLCEAPPGPDLEPCGQCPACVQVGAGTHPDYYTAVRPPESLEFPIELMRRLCQSFALKSVRGRGKVVLVDDADDLNEESANCFLKTLEEPPPRSVIILIGSSPERQLPTIVSRCQVIRFAPLPGDVVRELLEAHGVEDPALLDRLVGLSGGSPGQALVLADPVLWTFRRSFLEGLLQGGVDAVALGRSWQSFVEEAGKESGPQRQRARAVVRLLVDFFSDALALSVGGEPRRSEAADRPLLEGLVARTGPERLLGLLERCLDADRQIERRVQLILTLEGLLDAMAQRLAA